MSNTNSNIIALSDLNLNANHVLKRTLVVMPWAGLSKGVGNSKLGLRRQYLRACFWSFYLHYKNIVIAVPSSEEANIVTNILHLPAMEVLILSDMIKGDVNRLPMELLKQIQVNLRVNGEWSSRYDFVLYTESDHLLVLNRNRINGIYGLLKQHPQRVLVPHRLMPYARELMQVSVW